ncbi:Hydroquinone glucosyltransferase [Acorus gramineus]|uniref:Glycosyltransferase n=1 Tax=Acorus gramineus TaxID=55184 RepID=A0AAV9AXI1_ACOGR|nr:Hydroquinone glucosyltransferase [Acorus gramineus]
MSTDERTHIAIMPSPGAGHLTPLAELAKRLVRHPHDFSVTLIVVTIASSSSSSQHDYLNHLKSSTSIDVHQLPPADLSDLPDDVPPEPRFFLAVQRSLPHLRDSLATRSIPPFSALIVDFFAIDAFAVTKELGLPGYLYFTSSCNNLCHMFYLPILHATTTCEYRDLEEPIRLPGCVPIEGKDLLEPLQDRKSMAYRIMIDLAKRYMEAEGVLVNTFKAMEPGPMKALKVPEPGRPPVYAIGPMVQTIGPVNDLSGSDCLKWLDQQPSESVLFVCFGSGGTLSQEQLNELAFGLELSGQRFLWVVRSPAEKMSAAFFTGGGGRWKEDDLLEFLPEGFVERTRGKGLVVPSWAPQSQVLAHMSTGGFMSHCGWNSTLESVVNGVPLIAWPLYAEQKMNAVMLTEGVRIAIRAIAGEDGLVEREEVVRVVKGLMEEGKEVKQRVKWLQVEGKKALGEGGSSYKAMLEMTEMWRTPKKL